MNYRNAFAPGPPGRTDMALPAAFSTRRHPPVDRSGALPDIPPEGEKRKIRSRKRFRQTGEVLIGLIIVALLLAGWLDRDQQYIVASHGIGYGLGIVGSALMLLLLIYPLRRHWPGLLRAGRVTLWFRLHLIAGIIGPLLILYHAGFKTQSVLGTLAVMLMIAMALSGLLGRYLYGQLHGGIAGERIRIRDIIKDAVMFKRLFGADLQDVEGVARQMQEYETRLRKPLRGLFTGFCDLLYMRKGTGYCRRELKQAARRSLARQARRSGWNERELQNRIGAAEDRLDACCAALGRVAWYRIHERLFGFWYILHSPLILLVLATGLAHIIVVHIG